MSTSELPQVPADLAWPVILGIDPGTRLMGYGAIIQHADGPRMLAAGAIRGGSSKDVPTRLGTIREELDKFKRSKLTPIFVFNGLPIHANMLTEKQIYLRQNK